MIHHHQQPQRQQQRFFFQLLGPASMRTFRCLWMLEELGVPYEHISSAMPLSKEVRKYNPLGKVPVLIVHQKDDIDDNDDNNKNNNNNNFFVLYESSAINTYLADLILLQDSPQLPMSSTTTTTLSSSTKITIPSPYQMKERGLYNQTISILISELDSQGLWIHTKHDILGHLFTTIPEAVKHAKQYFHRINRTLMNQLKKSKSLIQQPPQQQMLTNDTSSSLSSSVYFDCGYYLLGNEFTPVDIIYVHCLEWSRSIGWDDKWKYDSIILQYFNSCTSRPAYHRAATIRQLEQQQQKKRQKQYKKKQSSKAISTATSNTSSNNNNNNNNNLQRSKL